MLFIFLQFIQNETVNLILLSPREGHRVYLVLIHCIVELKMIIVYPSAIYNCPQSIPM